MADYPGDVDYPDYPDYPGSYDAYGPNFTGYGNYTFDENYFDNVQYDSYFYPGYDFERPVYLVIWEVMVILTTIFNILVVIVFLGRRMINPTNIVLIAIAISDSMTGLVTLPAYIHVYNQFQDGGSQGQDVYAITKAWCEAFMISKFFLSKSFHMISIWLTVFLGFQRFIAVSYPFKVQSWFSNTTTVATICIIAVLSPLLHVYHLVDVKTDDYMCQWTLDKDCQGGCAYLWLTLLLMHFIPCTVLVLFTVLMIRGLTSSAGRMRHMTSSNRESTKRRAEENRRISIIVVIVVVVFLIPEIPYAIFLLINVIRQQAKMKLLPLDTNRALHCAYELLLVLSFHANFWVYTIGNKRFRDGLRKMIFPMKKQVYMMVGRSAPSSIKSRSDVSSTGAEGHTLATEMNTRSAVSVKLSNPH